MKALRHRLKRLEDSAQERPAPPVRKCLSDRGARLLHVHVLGLDPEPGDPVPTAAELAHFRAIVESIIGPDPADVSGSEVRPCR